MDISREQLLAINKLTGIKVKLLKTYFGYFNPPYNTNPRKEYVYHAMRCCSTSVNTLKKFTFLIDNLKCRHAADVVINHKQLVEIHPELF